MNSENNEKFILIPGNSLPDEVAWYDDMLEVEVRSKHYEDLKNLEEQKQAQRKFAEAVHKCYDDFIFCYSRRFTQEYRKSAEEASKILDEILKGDRKQELKALQAKHSKETMDFFYNEFQSRRMEDEKGTGDNDNSPWYPTEDELYESMHQEALYQECFRKEFDAWTKTRAELLAKKEVHGTRAMQILLDRMRRKDTIQQAQKASIAWNASLESWAKTLHEMHREELKNVNVEASLRTCRLRP